MRRTTAASGIRGKRRERRCGNGKEITLDKALYNRLKGVMKYEYLMTPADFAELAAIDASVKDARKRRARLMAKIRQRAWRERNGK